MNGKLYPRNLHGDSQIIIDLIEQVAPKEVDVLFTCTKDGVLATMQLRPPHTASWSITWAIKSPIMLDTGDELNPYPCLADPQCQNVLTEQLQRAYMKMYSFCDCQGCRPSP